jgi:hypothetical protein
MTHAGEKAELYVLGALSAQERSAVESHAAGCEECLRRIGEAEETLLAMEREIAATPLPSVPRSVLPFQRRGISAWWLVPAMAAALAFGMIRWHEPPSRSDALLAMIQSHFSHAQFSGKGKVPAKVIYARDHEWYYVIVRGSGEYDVYGVRGGVASMIGSTRANGTVSELFVRSSSSFDRLELRLRGETIEAAAIR